MTEKQEEADVNESVSPSIGKQLKAGRKAMGLSQQALADKLFLKIAIIQQLEDDHFDSVTSSTFIKGYIRLYAKNVDLDPEPLVDMFNASLGIQKTPQKLQSFSRRTTNEASDNRWMMVTYFILALVIALFVLWWYQQPESTVSEVTTAVAGPEAEIAEAENAESPVAKNEENAAMTNPVTNFDDVIETTAEQAELITESDDVVAVPTESAIEENQALLDLSPPVEQRLDEVQGQASVEVLFNFSGDCWVNITDATGDAIAYGTKVAGRIMPISGVPPFEVTLGAPQNVSITFAGEPVDLSDIPEGRSARFTLPR